MAYTPHTLLEFGGTLNDAAAGTEEWNCGIRGWSHNLQAPVPIADLDEWLDAIASRLATFFAASVSGMASNSALTYAKLNNINAAGRYAEAGTTHRHDYGSPVPGGVAATSVNFTSLAWTWETGFIRGRAHRGRMYPPNYTFAYTGATVASGGATGNANVGVIFVHDVLFDLGSEPFEDYFEPHVFSKLDGTHHAITGCSSDNIYDVQRRRKNQANPTRSAIIPLDVTP